MVSIAFHLNGTPIRLEGEAPTRTLLDWMRDTKGLRGTKEGCNEGDCGACTVMLSDASGSRAVNACILFLGQLHGKAVRTIEGISGPQGQHHPVQEAMIRHHGSQCGFCTPGFVVSMAVAHKNGDQAHDDVLAGNLCRCTGYAPIIRAAEAAKTAPVPEWLVESLPEVAPLALRPQTADELAAAYLAQPKATLVAGATDVGLWVTKQLRDISPVIFLNGVTDLQHIEHQGERIRIGAGVTITQLRDTLGQTHPHFAEMLRRYASTQVRNAATIGGNIANGSPIGDGPPALIAMGARLHLRKGDTRRQLPLEDFFIAYRHQDRQEGEFVEAITIPASTPNLRCYKISKRFDQDISALCGCINLAITEGVITQVRIAFGGMAATPKRARHVEAALIGQNFTLAAFELAALEMGKDYHPLSDMRASADYRLKTAQNLMIRYFHDLSGESVDVLGVAL